MGVNFQIDVNEIGVRMNRYVRELGRSGTEVVRDTTRRLVGDLLKITAPKNQNQGNKAVERDVKKAMTPFEPGKVRLPRLRKLIRDRDYDAINSIMKRSGGKWSKWEVVPVDPKIHQNARDKRGRVRKYLRKFILDKPALREYIKKMKTHVGKLKAGWNAAYTLVGGLMPSWISRHGNKYGAAIDLSRAPVDPSITILHTAPHNALIDEGKLSKALQMRAKAMDTDIKKALERAATASEL